MIQHGKPETHPPLVTEDSGAWPGEPSSSKALRKPQRQVNIDLVPGNMEYTGFALPACPCFSLLSMCPGHSSSTVFWEEPRPQVDSTSSPSPFMPVRRGRIRCTCSRQPLLPQLLISLPCPNSVTSPSHKHLASN